MWLTDTQLNHQLVVREQRNSGFTMELLLFTKIGWGYVSFYSVRQKLDKKMFELHGGIYIKQTNTEALLCMIKLKGPQKVNVNGVQDIRKMQHYIWTRRCCLAEHEMRGGGRKKEVERRGKRHINP